MNKKNKVKRINAKAQKARMLNDVREAKERVAGYEQMAQVQSAYISVLLKKLGATEDNKVEVSATDITEALEKYEARAIATENGFALYYVGKGEKK